MGFSKTASKRQPLVVAHSPTNRKPDGPHHSVLWQRRAEVQGHLQGVIGIVGSVLVFQACEPRVHKGMRPVWDLAVQGPRWLPFQECELAAVDDLGRIQTRGEKEGACCWV